MGIPKGEERKIKPEETFETVIAEKYPRLMSDTKPQIQETQRTPSRKITRDTTPGQNTFQ